MNIVLSNFFREYPENVSPILLKLLSFRECMQILMYEEFIEMPLAFLKRLCAKVKCNLLLIVHFFVKRSFQ